MAEPAANPLAGAGNGGNGSETFEKSTASQDAEAAAAGGLSAREHFDLHMQREEDLKSGQLSVRLRLQEELDEEKGETEKRKQQGLERQRQKAELDASTKKIREDAKAARERRMRAEVGAATATTASTVSGAAPPLFCMSVWTMAWRRGESIGRVARRRRKKPQRPRTMSWTPARIWTMRSSRRASRR